MAGGCCVGQQSSELWVLKHSVASCEQQSVQMPGPISWVFNLILKGAA